MDDMAPGPPPQVPEEVLRRGADQVLAERQGPGIGVFAYGSLLWEHPQGPGAKHPGRVRGMTPRYCLYDKKDRGTPERPSLTLGLEPGGEACSGAVLRFSDAELAEGFWDVWKREMSLGAYHARWVRVDTERGPLDAVSFVADPAHPLYAGALPEGEVARILATTSGRQGTAASYLGNTVEAWQGMGLHDSYLERLQARVTTLRS